jgi:hypothetical protein
MVSPALREGFPPQATGEPEGVMEKTITFPITNYLFPNYLFPNYQLPITFFPIIND